jgi:hypothetical protein
LNYTAVKAETYGESIRSAPALAAASHASDPAARTPMAGARMVAGIAMASLWKIKNKLNFLFNSRPDLEFF